MNKEIHETLETTIEKTRTLLNDKYKDRKRFNQNEVFERATLIRDIVQIKNWLEENKVN